MIAYDVVFLASLQPFARLRSFLKEKPCLHGLLQLPRHTPAPPCCTREDGQSQQQYRRLLSGHGLPPDRR